MAGEDVPIGKLVPLRERRINLERNKGFRRLVATIGSIGLIEPLCVYRENGHFVIVDGYLRYRACQKLGVHEVPCIVYEDKEAYTYNRMVNALSPVQERRMLQRSLETIDKATIADVFGMKSLTYRLAESVIKHLAPEVVAALDQGLMSRQCAGELAYVKHERQLQILREMKAANDYSLSFARAMVVKTPPSMRNPLKKHRKAWNDKAAKRRELVAKLQEIEKRHEFYTRLYQQYATDLLKLCSYARKLITNTEIRAALAQRFPEILARFDKIVFDTGGE